MKGLVIKNTGSWYQVKTDDGQSIECKIKGNFRLKGIRSKMCIRDRIEREPRMVIEGVDPGRPELLVTFTPAARPVSYTHLVRYGVAMFLK